MKQNFPRLVIAGVSSGTGKTTIVTGILASLFAQGVTVQSFKIGPDYIDTGFHKLASGVDAHNLDSWLVAENKIPVLFQDAAQSKDLSIIEGVMGLYDGGKNGVSSTASIAKVLQAPVILVINAKSMGESAAAIALGFKNYDPSVNMVGVIINNLGSVSHGELIKEALKKINIPVLGLIRRDNLLSLPERHLGLTPTEEQAELLEKIKLIQTAIMDSVDLEQIVALAKTAPPLVVEAEEKTNVANKVRIGIAHDEAFSFYYPASLRVLEKQGAELIKFSPLHDQKIPEVEGLFFGGGFPEMFARELSANISMKNSIQQAHKNKLPIYAECGGFMYLGESIKDFEENTHQMVGLVPGYSTMQERLQTVGYVEAKACTDNICTRQSKVLRGHEFHFSTFTPHDEQNFPYAFEFKKVRTGNIYLSGYAKDNLLASYLHMHLLSNEPIAARMVAKCLEYKQNHEE